MEARIALPRAAVTPHRVLGFWGRKVCGSARARRTTHGWEKGEGGAAGRERGAGGWPVKWRGRLEEWHTGCRHVPGHTRLGEHGKRALGCDSRIIAPTRSTIRAFVPKEIAIDRHPADLSSGRHPPDHQFRAGARQRERQHWSSSSIPRAIVSKRRRTPCHDDSGGNAPREE